MFGDFAEKDYGYFGGDEWKKLTFHCDKCGHEWEVETEDIDQKEYCPECDNGPFMCAWYDILEDDPRC